MSSTRDEQARGRKLHFGLHPDYENTWGGVDKGALRYEKLLYRVLERSFLDLSLLNDAQSRQEARNFFISPSRAPFSYNWICEYLDLNPSKLLSGCRELLVRSYELDNKLEKLPSFLQSPESYRLWLS